METSAIYEEQCVYSYEWTIKDFVKKLRSGSMQNFMTVASTKFKSHSGNYLWSLNLICESDADNLYNYNSINVFLEVACSNLTVIFHEKKIEVDIYIDKRSFYYEKQKCFNFAENSKKIFLMNDSQLPTNANNKSDVTIVFKAFEPFSPAINMPEIHNLSCDYGKLLKSGYRSDFKIVVGEQEFHVHKCILSARCEYFSLMFKYNESKGSNLDVLEISDVTHTTMSEILQYIYSAKYNVAEDLLYEVLTAADMYQVNGLKKKCEQKIMNNLKPNNVGECMIYAERYNNDCLKVASGNFLIKSASEFNEDDIKLLQSNLLSITCPSIASLLRRLLFKE